MSLTDASSRPFVTLATLCEKVLNEHGVLSLIRIVDTYKIAVPPNLPKDTKPHVSTFLVVSLRWPNETAEGTLLVRVIGPTKKAAEQKHTLTFPGGHSGGVNLILQLVMAVETFGDSRIEIFWNEDFLTAVPFTLAQGPPPAIDSAEKH